MRLIRSHLHVSGDNDKENENYARLHEALSCARVDSLIPATAPWNGSSSQCRDRIWSNEYSNRFLLPLLAHSASRELKRRPKGFFLDVHDVQSFQLSHGITSRQSHRCHQNFSPVTSWVMRVVVDPPKRPSLMGSSSSAG